MDSQYMDMPMRLRMIAEDFEFLSLRFGKDPVITRITDPVEGESGVHTDNRAFDARDMYSEEERLAIVNYINARWPRDDGKKVVIWHSFKGGPFHLHFQIPKAWA